MAEALTHTLRRMSGRDPHESGRAATPLELLFDLTFVIAFGTASAQLAHELAAGHVGEGLLGFVLAAFAVSWAWVNFTWFASAYDTDDWVYRLTTMVQMVGVIVLALGLPPFFESLVEGHSLDLDGMVAGYVVMRVPMIFQWLRAGQHDSEHRGLCRTMVNLLVVSQLGWVALALNDLTLGPALVAFGVLFVLEISTPVIAENRHGGSPWHAHHMAERYGLLVIIALGEGLLGTTAALGALVHEAWTVEAALLGLAGVTLVFGVWWTYFVIPFGHLLDAYRDRSFGFGYGHVPLFAAVVAIGSGLEAAALYLEHHSELSGFGTVVAVAIPVGVYLGLLFGLYTAITRTFDPFHVVLVATSAAVLALSVVLAAAGLDTVWCLAVLALTPWVTVVGYETRGHRHNAEVLARLTP